MTSTVKTTVISTKKTNNMSNTMSKKKKYERAKAVHVEREI